MTTPTTPAAETLTATEIAAARSHYLMLAQVTRRADGSLPADVRDGLAWTGSLMRRWAVENPGRG